MKGRRALAAVLVAAMVVLAMPVTATHQLVVGSQHTDGSSDELGGATTTNMTLSGSGAETSVVLATTDESYNPVTAEGDGTADGVTSILGDTAGDQPNHVEMKIRPTDNGTLDNLTLDIEDTLGSDYGFTVDIYIIQENPDQTYGEGTLIRSDWDPAFSSGEQTVTVDAFDFQANKNYTVEFVVSGSDNDGTEDAIRLKTDTSASTVWFTSVRAGTAEVYPDLTVAYQGYPASAVYESVPHNVSDAEEAAINITSASNVSFTIYALYDDGSGFVVGNQTTLSSTGNHTLQLPDVTADRWQINVTVDRTGSHPAFALADESILFTAQEPTVSLVSPADGAVADSETVTLEAQVNDSDFPLAQGDSVDAEFQVKEPGETGFDVENTQTVTSNGTITFDYTATDGGDYEWRVNVSDSYGHGPINSSTRTFTVPSEITFRNESNASEVVTGVNITATFYSADGTTVIQKTDSDNDGMISLAGLPTTKEFVVVVSASGWYDRRVYIKSIFTQQDVYLLNSTAFPNAIDTTFVYEDRTGDFPQETTTLRVQRALDKDDDGTFNWTTVAGDFWGAAGEFPFTGAQQVRYRLVVENAQGDQRILGTHIPRADGTKNIVIGTIEWPAGNATGRLFDADLNTATQEIVVQFADPENNTTNVRIRVWELSNTSNEIYNQTFTSGPYGRLVANVSLTSNQTGTSWVVNMTADHAEEGAIANQVTVGSTPFDLPVDPWLLGTLTYVTVTLVALLYGPRTAHIGAWAMFGLAGMIALFQLVTIPVAALIACGLVAAGGTFYREAT